MSDYFVCPNCGAEVSGKALACPECGSDDSTGWSENTQYDGLDSLEFEEAFEAECGTPGRSPSPTLFQNRVFLLIVALAALLIFLLVYVL